jgi:DNA-binding FadR family transcriptional regulator
MRDVTAREPCDTMKRQLSGVALADAIEKEVRTRKHKAGAVLGFESNLIARSGKGRSVVRQAIRILEQRGVAYSRRGTGGGLIVAQPEADSAIRALSIVISSQFADFTDISGLTSAIDNHHFLNCVGRVNLVACRELQELVQRVEALSADEFMNTSGHRQVLDAVSRAFGDPATALAQRTAGDCGIDLVPYAIVAAESRRRGEFWELTRQLVDALVSGNVPLLFELRMRQWRMFSAGWSSRGNLDRVRDRIPPKIEDTAGTQSMQSGAERLSREILRDIRQLGWKVGERIGGLDELTSRYGTSPSLLRQAVCILEEYSAVQMQRGRSGGLLIAAPDQEVAIQRAVSYLRWANTDPTDVDQFLIQLVLEALNRSPHTADRQRLPELRAVIDQSRRRDAKPDHRAKSALYLAITGLSNSPALQLFVRVLLTYLSDKPRKRTAPGAAESALLDQMFDSIITANTPNARRAFIQYTQGAESVSSRAMPIRARA